jgi:hypothetical protein
VQNAHNIAGGLGHQSERFMMNNFEIFYPETANSNSTDYKVRHFMTFLYCVANYLESIFLSNQLGARGLHTSRIPIITQSAFL